MVQQKKYRITHRYISYYSYIFNQVTANRYMTVLGKLEEYVSQLENAVNQLRKENEELRKSLVTKTAQGSLADELQE
jgi:hypothetical protein